MKNLIKILISLKYFILLVLVVGGAFYWFEWRPAQLRKQCIKEVATAAKDLHFSSIDFQGAYSICLAREGLGK